MKIVLVIPMVTGIIVGCELVNYSETLIGPFDVSYEFREVPLRKPLILYRLINDLCYPYRDVPAGYVANKDPPPRQIELTYDDKR